MATLLEHISSAVDGLLVGETPSAAKPRFSAFNHATASYTANLDFWLDGCDVTGQGVWNSVGGASRAFTMVAPDVFLYAPHWGIYKHSLVGCVDAYGVRHQRTVADVRELPKLAPHWGYDDIGVGVLSSPMPSSVGWFKVLPADVEDWLIDVLATEGERLPMILWDQEQKACIAEVGNVTKDYWGLLRPLPLDGLRDGFFETRVNHDSGYGGYLLIDGELVLAMTQSYGGNGGGPKIHRYLDELNAFITEMGSSSQLTTISLSEFEIPTEPVPEPDLPPHNSDLVIALHEEYGWFTDDGTTEAGNNDPVKRIANAAPGQSANFLAQDTEASRPLRINGAGPNGTDILRFDGSNDRQRIQNALTGSGYYMIALQKVTLPAGGVLHDVYSNIMGVASSGGFVFGIDNRGGSNGSSAMLMLANGGSGAQCRGFANDSHTTGWFIVEQWCTGTSFGMGKDGTPLTLNVTHTGTGTYFNNSSERFTIGSNYLGTVFAAVDFVSGFVFTSAKTEEQRQEIYDWFAQKVGFEPPPTPEEDEESLGPPLAPESESEMSGEYKIWDRIPKAIRLYAAVGEHQSGSIFPVPEDVPAGCFPLAGLHAGDEVVLRLVEFPDPYWTRLDYTRTGSDTLDAENNIRIRFDMSKDIGDINTLGESSFSVFSRASYDDLDGEGDGIAVEERIVCNDESKSEDVEQISSSETLDVLSFLRSLFGSVEPYNDSLGGLNYQAWLALNSGHFAPAEYLTVPSTGVPVLASESDLAGTPGTVQVFQGVAAVHTGDVTLVNSETQTEIENGVTEIDWGLVLGDQVRRFVFEIRNNEWSPLLIDDVSVPSGVNVVSAPSEIAPHGVGLLVLGVDSSEPDGTTGGTVQVDFATYQGTAEEDIESIEFTLSGDVQPVPAGSGKNNLAGLMFG